MIHRKSYFFSAFLFLNIITSWCEPFNWQNFKIIPHTSTQLLLKTKQYFKHQYSQSLPIYRIQRNEARTVRNVREIDPCGWQRLLVPPRELQNVPESRDRNGTLYPIGSDRSGYRVRDLEDVGAGRQTAILKVPPHRNPHTPGLLVVASRRMHEMGWVKRRGWEMKYLEKWRRR